MGKKRDFSTVNTISLNARQIYLYGDLGFLLGHIIYLTVFFNIGLTPMVYYNFFSISFYAVMAYAILKYNNYAIMIMLAMAEIMIHSTLGALFMGWSAGFGMFFPCIVMLPFFVASKKRVIPFALAAINIALFLTLKISLAPGNSFEADVTANDCKLLYIINAVFGYIVLIYISTIYIIIRNRNQQEMKDTNEQLKKLANIDPLTELFNRRAMMEYLKVIQNGMERNGNEYSLCICDIDDFKQINDTYGHDIGDVVLRKIAEIITSFVPAEGYVCRWGGEEFLFAIPSCDVKDAAVYANLARNEISHLRIEECGDSFKVSMTFGLSSVSSSSNYEIGIRNADKCLYIGKSSGKNCVRY